MGIKTKCPNCGCLWGVEEMDWGECFACGYPDINDDYDDDFGIDNDDDSLDPNDSRNL